MNTKITQAYCKLSCFQLVIANKFNICKCNPYCKLLNNTMSKNTPIYLQGPVIKQNDKICDCITKCTYTHCSIDIDKYKHIKSNYEV